MYTNLRQLIEQSDNIVFFGGAGVSTQSGIPDFRSMDGLYAQKFDYPPEAILSHSFFISQPEQFYKFYKNKMLFQDALPNKTHISLAYLEKIGKLKAIITQNIDGLHQAAGSKNVYELHGSVHRNCCMDCGKFYPLNFIQSTKGIPHCSCEGIVKPEVVLYGEALKDDIIAQCVSAISKADLLIIGGTSLNVYPAAGMINYFQGAQLVLINQSQTSADAKADLVIRDPIGDVFGSMFPKLFQ